MSVRLLIATGALAAAVFGGNIDPAISSAEQLPCSTLTPQYSFQHTDPTGDQQYPDDEGRDILSVSGSGNDDVFCLTITFANIVDPALTDAANRISVGFDTDEEAATGQRFGFAQIIAHESHGYYRCGSQAYIGADKVLRIPDGGIFTPGASDSSLQVPLHYSAHTVTAEIPLLVLGGDPEFNVEIMLGYSMYLDASSGHDYATDCAPNGNSLHSPDGAIVPPQDDDHDGTFDSEDNCPGLANDQVDSDVDEIGDPCDPTPTHGYRVLHYDGKVPPINMQSRRSATIHWWAVIENLYPWASPATIQAPRIEGLPNTCSRESTPDGWGPGSVVFAPSERLTLQWTTVITCYGLTPSGTYDLLQPMEVYHSGMYYARVGQTKVDAEVTLRINNPKPDISDDNRMDAMSIDLDVTGATATTLGPRNSCREVNPGDEVTFDVSAEGIPSSDPMIAFTFRLNYPPPYFTVTHADSSYLLAATPGSNVFDLSDVLPDSDGAWRSGAADISNLAMVTPESGSGVLARLTLEVAANTPSGVYAMTLSEASHIDTFNDSRAPNLFRDAFLAVGASCQDDRSRHQKHQD
jgi:hypothetical protein